MKRPGAVEANDPGPLRARDGVGFETLAVIQVEDLDHLVRRDVGRLEQRPVHREAAFVGELRLGDSRPVDL